MPDGNGTDVACPCMVRFDSPSGHIQEVISMKIRVKEVFASRSPQSKNMSCVKCKKPTRSHIAGDRAICHTCWLKMPEDERAMFEVTEW